MFGSKKKPANQGSAGPVFMQKPGKSGVPSASKPAKAEIKFSAVPKGTRGTRNK